MFPFRRVLSDSSPLRLSLETTPYTDDIFYDLRFGLQCIPLALRTIITYVHFIQTP